MTLAFLNKAARYGRSCSFGVMVRFAHDADGAEPKESQSSEESRPRGHVHLYKSFLLQSTALKSPCPPSLRQYSMCPHQIHSSASALLHKQTSNLEEVSTSQPPGGAFFLNKSTH